MFARQNVLNQVVCHPQSPAFTPSSWVLVLRILEGWKAERTLSWLPENLTPARTELRSRGELDDCRTAAYHTACTAQGSSLKE